MPIEMDEKRAEDLLKAEELLKRLYANKETKRDIERLAKKVNPDAVTGEDMLEPYVKDMRDELAELKEFKKSIQANMKDYGKNQSVKRLKDAGYTEDGIKAVEKIMADNGFDNYEIAAAYWDKIQPTAPVSPNGISPSLMFDFQGAEGEDAESTKLLLKNEDAWLDREADKVMKEIKSGRF